MYVKSGVVLLACLLALSISPVVEGFNVGVKGTKCNLDPTKGELNDPCQSLYDGVCGGKYCECPPGTHEDPGLKRCLPGDAPKTSVSGSQSGGGGGGGDFDLFDDVIDNYPGAGKKTPSAPPAPPPAVPPPPQPQPPRQPQPPNNPNQPGFNPNQPGIYNPNQPGYNPNQPGIYNPNQPGYNPNQPGIYNPNQPGIHNPNQPGHHPNQPGSRQPGTKGDDNIGEKAGGGVGGAVGLLIIGAIIYFCCCRGGKHKEMMNKFGGGRFQGIPFIGGGQQAGQGGQMQMQQSAPIQHDPNFGSQHTYIPPGGVPQPDQSQYGAPQQPYPPPAGGYYPMVPGDPYAQQPGYAPYPPQQGGGPIPMQPPMQPPPGMPMQPPPGMPMPQNLPYAPQVAPYVATAPPEGFAPDGQPPPYTPHYQPNAPPPQ